MSAGFPLASVEVRHFGGELGRRHETNSTLASLQVRRGDALQCTIAGLLYAASIVLPGSARRRVWRQALARWLPACGIAALAATILAGAASGTRRTVLTLTR